MSEIPEDVIDAAIKVQDMVDQDPRAYVAFDIAVLAILAERERCAKIAEGMADGYALQPKGFGVFMKATAASIRGTSNP